MTELDSVKDAQVVIKRVLQWLREHDGWLLIFDNADDLSTVRAMRCMPDKEARGHVLLTTRASETAFSEAQLGFVDAAILRLRKLPQAEGETLLLRRAGHEGKDLGEMSRRPTFS